MTYFQKIVIVCPPQISATWGTSPIADLFDSAGNLSLRIQPDHYTRIEEGTASQFNDLFNGVGYNHSPQRIGFSIAIQDKRDELAIAVKELARLSLGTQYTNFSTITVLDYIRVDNAADYAAGFTTRIGKLWVENLTGTVQRGNLICATPLIETPQAGRYNNGFTLKFLSSKKEVIA